MSQAEIIEEIKKLKNRERLAVVQAAIMLIGDDMNKNVLEVESQYLPLAEAARVMKAEYEADRT